jgi:Ca-activated chloride channel family protein
MFFEAGDSGPKVPALSQAASVHFDISGMIASVVVEQTFRNNSERWVEGVYVFPLPEMAAVRHMEMRIGERRIVGQIKEKSVAKKIYAAARQAGKKASLLEQQRPNIFSNKVANIGPGEEIIVRLEYVQTLEFNRGEFSLRFPMTITPRYQPGHALHDLSARAGDEVLTIDRQLGWVVAPTAYPVRVLNPIVVTARLDMGMPLARIEASYHKIVLQRDRGLYELSLAGGVSEMDRDFVLRWTPVTGSAPSAAVFTEQIDGDFYGLLMLVPPALAVSSQDSVLARETIFVIDTSGSMGGVSITQARQSLTMALGHLRPQDSFNIIEFNSNYSRLFREPVPATRHYLQKAAEFVRQLSAGGGTEMLPALRAALAVAKPGGEQEGRPGVRQVIFITDGAVSNELQLFQEIEQTLGDSRMFTVGIGSAPNSWFMRKAAQFGRGSHTHIGDTSEVAEKMQALFEQIATPLSVDIRVSWPGQVEAYPQRIPDLYAGAPVLVAFKYSEGEKGATLGVSGVLADQSWERHLQLAGSNKVGVASIWAREKIAALLDQKVLGVSEEQVREKVLAVALSHALMSPYTSFVAVEERVSRPSDSGIKKVAVPNTQPRGQLPVAVSYPATATTGPANFFLGSLFAFLLMMTHVMRQPEPGSDETSRD